MAVFPLSDLLTTLKDGISKALKVKGEVELTGSKAKNAYPVTPNDNADLPNGVTAGLYVGNAGKVKVTLEGGTTVTFMNLASGAIHPIAAKRVWATDTDADNILAVY